MPTPRTDRRLAGGGAAAYARGPAEGIRPRRGVVPVHTVVVALIGFPRRIRERA